MFTGLARSMRRLVLFATGAMALASVSVGCGGAAETSLPSAPRPPAAPVDRPTDVQTTRHPLSLAGGAVQVVVLSQTEPEIIVAPDQSFAAFRARLSAAAPASEISCAVGSDVQEGLLQSALDSFGDPNGAQSRLRMRFLPREGAAVAFVIEYPAEPEPSGERDTIRYGYVLAPIGVVAGCLMVSTDHGEAFEVTMQTLASELVLDDRGPSVVHHSVGELTTSGQTDGFVVRTVRDTGDGELEDKKSVRIAFDGSPWVVEDRSHLTIDERGEVNKRQDLRRWGGVPVASMSVERSGHHEFVFQGEVRGTSELILGKLETTQPVLAGTAVADLSRRIAAGELPTTAVGMLHLDLTANRYLEWVVQLVPSRDSEIIQRFPHVEATIRLDSDGYIQSAVGPGDQGYLRLDR